MVKNGSNSCVRESGATPGPSSTTSNFTILPARSIETRQRLIAFEFPFDPVAVVNEFITWYGPALRAYASLDFDGRNALRGDLEKLWSENNRASDGTTYVESEYLEVIATVR